jgi:predicted transcriptional regulator
MKQENATPGMRRTEIRAVFNRNPGSKTKLAKSLGVSLTAVTLWLGGKMTSARIAAAALALALELVAGEREAAA